MTAFFNTGLTQQQFLEQYWQKKPLLIKQAFSDFQSPIKPDDLIQLACEANIESRLIEENRQTGSWQLKSENLSPQDFQQLPATHWTVLVQDIDKHLPELQNLMAPFRFIPDWRRDDLMVSYAPESGSVGAHTDSYDVFLLQAMGSRRWQVSAQPVLQPELIEGLDLQILKAFNPDQSWDLAAGDMLYLPPNFAHHGVALDDCITFSFGFRAPSRVDILDAMTHTILESALGRSRYSDPDLKTAQHPHQIGQQAVLEVKQLLHDAIDEAEPIIATALGCLVTDTKTSLIELAEEAISDLPTAEELTVRFEQGEILERNLYYRFAWSTNNQESQLFFAGESYNLESYEHAIILTENTLLTETEWSLLNLDSQSVDLLCELIAEGGWFWQSTP